MFLSVYRQWCWCYISLWVYSVCVWQRERQRLPGAQCSVLCPCWTERWDVSKQRWWHHFLAGGSRETTVPGPETCTHPITKWATVSVCDSLCVCVWRVVTRSVSTCLPQLVLNQTEGGQPTGTNGSAVCTCATSSFLFFVFHRVYARTNV